MHCSSAPEIRSSRKNLHVPHRPGPPPSVASSCEIQHKEYRTFYAFWQVLVSTIAKYSDCAHKYLDRNAHDELGLICRICIYSDLQRPGPRDLDPANQTCTDSLPGCSTRQLDLFRRGAGQGAGAAGALRGYGQACREGVAAGLALRHDHGSRYPGDHFQGALPLSASSPARQTSAGRIGISAVRSRPLAHMH